ncbi:MAG: hypothetical protein ACN6QT_09935 [Burkholderia contaminans]|jgi:hypothetical protein|uniref:Proline rich protein n=1 Tax=Burkholderia contaminans TaxID=488447 RepID=A0AAP4VGV4_9BURK|nr:MULTISPECIES: hypothetical protein [Burkholderia]MBD1416797.1 hypothetical protein [Burkholderia contaminans]MBH9669870.1 hypothetical protein [Burkholderia contaminans]MBH9677112.1 hypothetical protein [Burkholderia contaminans]MBH9707536.1 hypothetical protein [Burkholderia contaminans]MBH9723452.1 hypothetical protein [Burkholderia contaminans]
MISAAMKPASRHRLALALACLVVAGTGYRVLVAAMQQPAPAAASIVVRHDGVRAASAPARARVAPASHAAAPAPAPAPHAAAPTPREQLAALRAPVSVEAAHDPFTASSWLPPPPVVPPPPETRPAPPTAPPVPFVYLGQQDARSAKPQVFLGNGDQLLIVSPGDVIGGQYRVESVSGSNVVLTYLPLNQVQTVLIPVEGK